MKKPHSKVFDAAIVAAAILHLPPASVSALVFGPIPEPSICNIQTDYVRDLPLVPTPAGGGGGGGGGGGYSFNLPNVRINAIPLFFLNETSPQIFFFWFC